jgi:hypothetical protein
MRAFYLLLLAIAAGFPNRALDLLLALSPEVFAQAAPVENRESTPEVALDPVLGLLNVSFATSRMHPSYFSLVRPLAAKRRGATSSPTKRERQAVRYRAAIWLRPTVQSGAARSAERLDRRKRFCSLFVSHNLPGAECDLSSKGQWAATSR